MSHWNRFHADAVVAGLAEMGIPNGCATIVGGHKGRPYPLRL